MVKYEVKFTFTTFDYPDPTPLSFNNIKPFKECDCCWVIYMPADLEYIYTEYLAEHNLNYEKRDYINPQHRKDSNIIYFQNEIQFLKDYNWNKIPDTFAPCSLIINNIIFRYKSLRDLYIDCADRIIKIIEEHMHNLNNWHMHHNFISLLKNPKRGTVNEMSGDLFGFSNNGKKIIDIKLAKNVPKISTV
jgi:hypothetical protein